MKFGENLYNLRKNKKMSQEKLAERIGVSRQSVSKWETGDAYPEMNRILELCKIFHCQLNDLVNDNILDIDSLDEEIKMNVIKFNKEKQKKLKVASKIISYYSKTAHIITLICSIIMLISIFFIPLIINNIDLNEKDILKISNNELNISDGITIDSITNIINTHSKTEIIIYSIIGVLCCIILIMIISFIMLYLSKLFKNIHNESTPFTLENLKYIKNIIILSSSYLIIPYLLGLLFNLITKIHMDITLELSKIIYILIGLCIYYLFDYGHQIQLDSKGKIYGDNQNN